MASTTGTGNVQTGAGGERGGQRGRGRGRGGGPRGGGDHGIFMGGPSGDRGGSRGRGRGRGGGRGRGDKDRAYSQGQTSAAGQQRDPTNAHPPPQPGGEGVSGASLARDAPNNEGSTTVFAPVDTADDDAEVCFICASPIDHHSVAPCNHRTCHVCALRLRALYKTKACAHCRSEAATVIFTDDAEKRFEDYIKTDFHRTDDNMGICYEKQEIFEDTVILLRYNCPDEHCDVACLGWPDLHRHVRTAHQKVLCDLCTRNKKVFTHEHQLFTQQGLKQHERKGDDNPGAVDQTGFEGHPECGFCRQRFYGRDELFTHCRDRHERCHLCDRHTDANNPRYFIDYNSLEQHFSKDHFPCMDSECQEKKFVVFDSELDLKAHQLEQHPNGLSKDARRDARRVDISSFNYRPNYQEERPQREARGGRRAGRGRDPNADGPLPATSAQMSRAEIAHARAREIQSAQSVSTRTFGGQLSQPDPTPRGAQTPRPAVAHPIADAIAPPSPRAAEALTPAEQARRLRHAAVTERASNLLQNDQTKLTSFRDRISAYRNGTTSASDLIDTFFALFDTSSQELGKLIKELADIFEVPGKRDALLKAWSDWKAINEDYPSLPGPSGPDTTSAAGIIGNGIGGSRVLKLKSSTAQSSRAAGQPASWNAASRPTNASPANGATGAFPSLPARTNGAAKPTSSGWLALRPANSASSSARTSAAPSRTASSTNLPRSSAKAPAADLFPALPAAKKPTSSVFSPGYKGAGVIRSTGSGTSTPAHRWGASGIDVEVPSAAEADANQKQAKGRKGKQVVFQWG
ncbi:hypothetical protein LTR95_010494 [Oleoguttula sp. CCFEE 5521]